VRVLLFSDSHFNHANIATYCDRPGNFTDIIIKRWQERVKPEDTVIHLGDVIIGRKSSLRDIMSQLPGRKSLIRGNHDRQKSCTWWMENGFDFACDGMRFRNCWLTHEPDTSRAGGCDLNIHGHLHNIWDGFQAEGQPQLRLHHEWQRLFACEYTNYCPIEFDEFVLHPDKYQARGKIVR
jgi:calcineurin-like phosphoesterase family protein